MSYASPIKSLPETFRSSTSLAILASLGVHGLLWVVLPVIPFSSKLVEPDSRRTVGLVELTPDEQSRLPQVSTSPPSLPPFGMEPSGLPTLPPAPDANLLQPPSRMSASKDILKVPLPPEIITFSEPLPRPLLIPPSQNGQSYTRQVPIIKKPRFEVNQRYNLRNFRSLDDTLRGLTAAPVDPNQLQAPTPASTPQADINRQNANLQNTTPQDQLASSESPATPARPRQIPQAAINRLRELQQQYRQQAAGKLDNSPSNERQEIRYLSAWGAWSSKLQEDNPSLNWETAKPISGVVQYPKEACPQKASAQIVYGIHVDDKDTIVGKPELLLGTKNDAFDRAALKSIQTVSFKSLNNKHTLYQVYFDYKYNTDNCSIANPQPTTPNSNNSNSQPTTPKPTTPNLQPTTPNSNNSNSQPTPPNSITPNPQPTTPNSNNSNSQPTPPNPTTPNPQPTTPNSNTDNSKLQQLLK